MAFESHKKHNCFCAFCKTPRRIYLKKSVGFFHVVGAFLTAFMTMLILWQEFRPEFIIFFVLFLIVSEMFVQFRWRSSVVCKVCGFDPVLYTKNPKKAAESVKFRLDERKESPEYLLAKPLNLPTISPEKARALDKKGTLVSRQI